MRTESRVQRKISEKTSKVPPALKELKKVENTESRKTQIDIEGSEEIDSKGKDDVMDQKEEESVWLTKHSKAYKRALRQEALWQASAAKFTPSRGLILQARGSSSSKKISH